MGQSSPWHLIPRILLYLHLHMYFFSSENILPQSHFISFMLQIPCHPLVKQLLVISAHRNNLPSDSCWPSPRCSHVCICCFLNWIVNSLDTRSLMEWPTMIRRKVKELWPQGARCSIHTFVLLLERNISDAGFAETVTIRRTSSNGYQKRLAEGTAFWFQKQILCPSQTSPLEKPEMKGLEPRLRLMQLKSQCPEREIDENSHSIQAMEPISIGVASEGFSVML